MKGHESFERWAMGIQKWRKGAPMGLIMKGHTKFLIRGTQDPESSAIAVVVVPAKPMIDEEKAFSHAAVGLSYMLVYDVQGDGNDFEERRMYELEGALWKVRT
jgi:hypothetical protein